MASFSSSSSSSSSLLSLLHIFLLVGAVVGSRKSDRFDKNYRITWGYDHVSSLKQGTLIQLSLDQSSGAGFASKKSYRSGLFHMRIKLPPKDSAGVVTAFYLTSDTKKHDELDFEFLGNREGKPSTLQTNVFVNGRGGREERTLLWFDPTADFHSYKILWNPHQIVFYVDDIPIRVFKNRTKMGVDYPSQPMQIEGSLWNGEEWATDGGKTKINWRHAPFKSQFKGFEIKACPSQHSNCHANNLWWNQKKFWKLDSHQQKAYQNVRKKYMNYDYCSDTKRYPVPPKECTR